VFERYNESARRVLFFARHEVTELGGTAIESEHLLLGLLRENNGLLSRLLAPLPAQKVRTQIASRSQGQTRIATSVEIPFSAETKRVLNLAAGEADRLLPPPRYPRRSIK
jgi:ATP-dependent Clp protease ATP-binding subunit ClpC